MYLVVIGWLYVALLMAVAEAVSPAGTLLGAFFTLLIYGAIPWAVVIYVMATPLRRKRALQAEQQRAQPPATPPSPPQD